MLIDQMYFGSNPVLFQYWSTDCCLNYLILSRIGEGNLTDYQLYICKEFWSYKSTMLLTEYSLIMTSSDAFDKDEKWG